MTKFWRKRLSPDAVNVSSEGIFEEKNKNKMPTQARQGGRPAERASERASERAHTAIDVIEDGSV